MESGDNQFFKDRPSTKVHAAPGGNSSIVFGDGHSRAAAPVREAHAAPCVARALHTDMADVKAAGSGDSHGERSQKKMIKTGLSGSYQQDVHPQPTGQNESTQKTSVRVRHPPGGATSFSLG
eukprot:GHVS01074013.1.p2 GENE.GHVS01074013.1~~GHVS01074013.1.p2  ORF type:complete len:122 (+),score=16.93 GHVS01074013.1:142-507(+)